MEVAEFIDLVASILLVIFNFAEVGFSGIDGNVVSFSPNIFFFFFLVPSFKDIQIFLVSCIWVFYSVAMHVLALLIQTIFS